MTLEIRKEQALQGVSRCYEVLGELSNQFSHSGPKTVFMVALNELIGAVRLGANAEDLERLRSELEKSQK